MDDILSLMPFIIDFMSIPPTGMDIGMEDEAAMAGIGLAGLAGCACAALCSNVAATVRIVARASTGKLIREVMFVLLLNVVHGIARGAYFATSMSTTVSLPPLSTALKRTLSPAFTF